ncbi:oleate activated transcription factor 3 [Rhypophila decipiens]|uniref:Oleate activated transcription factor 3 n=1 Tax=Rhypophila decipiens TaxID=261697 RepID=A0AAN6Y4F9_9PEZI|nr:oleate activated transcription factor 3 [Rhypophila decipiens]
MQSSLPGSGMRPSRAERTTTSCGECRRRKQKLANQRRPSATPSTSPQQQTQQPPFALEIVPPSLDDNDNERYEIQGTREPLLPPRRHPSPFGGGGTHSAHSSSPWPPNFSPSGAAGRSEDVGDLLGRWSGFDLMGNQLPPLMAGSSSSQHHQQGYNPSMPWGRSTSPASGGSPGGGFICDEECTMHSEVVHDAAKLLMAFRSIPDRFIVGGGTSPGPPSGISPSGSSSWSPESATSVQQQQQQWDSAATAMMLDHVTLPSDTSMVDVSGIWPFGNPNTGPPSLMWEGRRGHQFQHPQRLVGPVPMETSLQQQQQLMAESRGVHNTDLLRIYVKLISQFKASLDGNPDASNPYIKYHVPYCVQSPLLQHVAIYTAAGLLSQTGHIESTVAMAHKGHAIKLLNEHLRSRSSTSDEGIAGVVQLIVNEWYWGDPNDLRAHLRGLREMIKLRGGFRTLGLHGLISKLAITSDIAIALSFEIAPFLRGGSEFDFQDTNQIPFRLALNTPLMSPLPPFSSCDEALHIHAATASILDDMRFLMAAVLALPEEPSPKELQKINTTAAWINRRIAGLPETNPTGRRRPSRDVSPVNPSSLAPESAVRGRGTSEGADELRPPQQQQQQARRRSFQSNPTTASTMSTSPIPPNNPRFSPPSRASSIPSSAIDPSLQVQVDPDQNTTPDPPADPIYQAVRLAALLYSRSIMLRQPFSQTVASEEFLQLWTTTWRVPLGTWRGLLGILNWLLVPILPAAKLTTHDIYTKALMSSSLLQMGMDNWELCRGVMENAVRLQRWLGGNSRRQSSPGGSGEYEEAGSSRGFGEEQFGGGATADWRSESVASAGSGSDGGRGIGSIGKGKGKDVGSGSGAG